MILATIIALWIVAAIGAVAVVAAASATRTDEERHQDDEAQARALTEYRESRRGQPGLNRRATRTDAR